MNGKWKLWTYPVMDIKAAQAELERMDRMGWRLDKVYLGFLAHFVPTGRRRTMSSSAPTRAGLWCSRPAL